mmetsp:Transcript_141/g.349  ORF Transcript_141/g.349 Transcript_141/m.349 type:complete len:435 (+) Transcript_141:462-1766(+)
MCSVDKAEIVEGPLVGVAMVSFEEGVRVVPPDEAVQAAGDVERDARDGVGGEGHGGEALRHLHAGVRAALHGRRLGPVTEGADRDGDFVLLHAGAYEGRCLVHAEDVGVRVVDAHDDGRAVHGLVGAACAGRCLRANGQPPRDSLHRHLRQHLAVVGDVPHEHRLALEAEHHGVLVVLRAGECRKVRSPAAGGTVRDLRQRGHGEGEVGVVGARGVVVAMRVVRVPDLSNLVGTGQAQIQLVARVRAGLLGVLHASHPAVDLVVLALQALCLQQRTRAAHTLALPTARMHVLNHLLPQRTEGDAVLLAQSVHGGQEHAAVPHAVLRLGVSRHHHSVRCGAKERSPGELVVEVLVNPIAEHKYQYIARRTEIHCHGETVHKLNVEVARRHRRDVGVVALVRVLHEDRGREGDEHPLIGVKVDGACVLASDVSSVR